MIKVFLLISLLWIIIGCSVDKEKRECWINDEEYVRELTNDLINLVGDENVSFGYYDINSGVVIKYQGDKVYYAASTIKLVNALYIYSLAREGKISLDTKIDEVTIDDLVNRMILVSDNEAHLKLLEYLGVDNLREFGKSLGAVNILVGDMYGNINVNEGIEYLKQLYKFIKVDDYYGMKLYDLFLNADVNYNPIGNINFLHKYGHYGIYFNDLAIYDIDNPYLVVFLSKYGKENWEDKLRYFYIQVYDIHNKYWKYRINYCK